MGPALSFDKSAFQALSRDEHGQRLFMFMENTTPILLREIVADLTKPEASGIAANRLVSSLASKFCGDGGAVSMDWKALCLESLAGSDVPMTGQIIPHGLSHVAGSDREPALFLGPTEANQGILRWARSQFTAEERVTADKFRREAEAFELGSLWGRLDRGRVTLAKSIEAIPPIVDDFLDSEGNYPDVLNWLVDQLRPLSPQARIPELRRHILDTWRRDRRVLRSAAPYPDHCARSLLMLLVGSNVLSQRPTNRLDIEYLLYLPFCHLFVSNDKVHRQLINSLLRPYQMFATGDDFKRDLARFVETRDATEQGLRRRRSFAFGTRPWPAPKSVLWTAWEKAYPWYPGAGNGAVRLDAAEQALAVAEAKELVASVNL